MATGGLPGESKAQYNALYNDLLIAAPYSHLRKINEVLPGLFALPTLSDSPPIHAALSNRHVSFPGV